MAEKRGNRLIRPVTRSMTAPYYYFRLRQPDDNDMEVIQGTNICLEICVPTDYAGWWGLKPQAYGIAVTFVDTSIFLPWRLNYVQDMLEFQPEVQARRPDEYFTPHFLSTRKLPTKPWTPRGG